MINFTHRNNFISAKLNADFQNMENVSNNDRIISFKY